MGDVSKHLTAEKFVDGKKHFAVRSFPVPERLKTGEPFPQLETIFHLTDGSEVEFFPTDTAVEGHVAKLVRGAIVLYVDTRHIEWIWAALAARCEAFEKESRPADEVSV